MDNKWKKFLLIWCICLLILGAVLCVVLYKYLGVYEITRPEPVIEKMVSEYLPEEWYNAARNNPNLDVNEFEDQKLLYDSYISNSKLDDGKISYFVEASKGTDTKAVYGIRSGVTTIAEVTLTQDETRPVGFNRCEWKLESVSMPDILKHLSSKNVFISVPKDEAVICNGKSVTDTYLSNEEIEMAAANRFEKGGKLPEGYVTYDLGKMYGDISISTTSGKELVPSENENRLIFSLSADNKYSLSVSAPEDVSIFINGIEVEKSEGSVDSTQFENLDDFTRGKGYSSYKYIFTGFMNKPTVEAKDSKGDVLNPLCITDGKYVFMHANDSTARDEHEEFAKEYFKRYLTYALNADVEYSALESVLRRCYVNSELFSYLVEAEDALMWKRQSKVESSEINFDNFSMISDDCFVCSVEYTIHQVAENEFYTDSDENLHNAFQMVFVKHDGLWVCAKMDSIA